MFLHWKMNFFKTEKTIRVPATISSEIILKYIQIRLFQKGAYVPRIIGNTFVVYNKDCVVGKPGKKGGWIFSATDFFIVLHTDKTKRYNTLSFEIRFKIKRYLFPILTTLVFTFIRPQVYIYFL
jgi:hypothetical protein